MISFDPAPITFYQRSTVTIGLSYRFRDKRQFQSKIANFSLPVYFAPPLTGFPLESGIGASDQKLE